MSDEVTPAPRQWPGLAQCTGAALYESAHGIASRTPAAEHKRNDVADVCLDPLGALRPRSCLIPRV
jgi:hypothetical protein